MNILLTSIGRRTYMVDYFKEALKDIGLIHAANSIDTYAMRLADKSIVTPLIYNENYIDFILKYSLENNINAIISLFDIDLPLLSKNKQKFAEKGITVVVSNYEFTQICNDKWSTYLFLKKNGFKTPSSYLTIKKAMDAIENNDIQFPLIIKPRWGMGSIGIFQADNKEELYVLYKKTQNSINESYLKYESQQAFNESIIIQEKLNGQEYGIDILNDLNGQYISCVPKKKLAMRAGETDIAEIVDNIEMVDMGKKLSSFTKHVGNLDVDYFYYNNKFYILEMNCRFGGQYPFSHLAGTNFPKVIVKMLLNEKIDDNLLKAKVGTIGIKDLVPVKLK